jgi:NADPH:quinone reductase-like Zn-dependent oxidoreductase
MISFQDLIVKKSVEKHTPKDHKVLIRLEATTATPMDWRFRNGKILIARFMTGLLKLKAGYRMFGIEFIG